MYISITVLHHGLIINAYSQVHIAAWPIYPDKSTLNYPDPYTNVSDPNSDIVSAAYAIETCAYVLAPFQRLSQEGVAKNTPPGVDVETPERYNGHTRIYGPDGTLLAKPGKDFEGLVFVDVCPQIPSLILPASYPTDHSLYSPTLA